jgi:hypothetical protein
MERYRIGGDGESITCLKCGFTSHNPNDVNQKYCYMCHVFHEDEQEAEDAHRPNLRVP